ncbi:MAG: endo-1,4-beta-xylanase [Cyclobacteriaceae bacterium]|nr:endo-1,4-beta-xylanase [Cyclobacteriaceae bacterium]
MKLLKFLLRRIISVIFMMITFLLLQVPEIKAQELDIGQSIARHRKGELVVKTKPNARISIEQLSHEFWFGCALADGIFNGSATEQDIKEYKEKFLENFNSAVTENAVKWGSMERRKGEVNYAVIDAMLEWTEKNNIPLRAHNLFWGIERFVQPWVKELSDEKLEQTLKNRAETVTDRYKGRFVEYDLNNEMIHGNYYEKRLGPGITKQMAEWAHNGDPGIRLFLNDYDILTGNMLAEYIAQIRLLQKQDVPVDGIGVQGHLHAETFDRAQLINALDSLGQFGLPVRITEFNMPGQRSEFHHNRTLTMTTEEEELNARELVDYYRICFAHPAVEGILMWGFWAGANWIPASSLYRKDWTPTPAAEAYKELIFNEWWTREDGKSDSNGELSTPAFFGKYRVTVDGESREVNLTKAAGRLVVEF